MKAVMFAMLIHLTKVCNTFMQDSFRPGLLSGYNCLFACNEVIRLHLSPDCIISDGEIKESCQCIADIS